MTGLISFIGDFLSGKSIGFRLERGLQAVWRPFRGNPEGIERGTFGDGRIDLLTGTLYLKQTASGTTGWVAMAGTGDSSGLLLPTQLNATVAVGNTTAEIELITHTVPANTLLTRPLNYRIHGNLETNLGGETLTLRFYLGAAVSSIAIAVSVLPVSTTYELNLSGFFNFFSSISGMLGNGEGSMQRLALTVGAGPDAVIIDELAFVPVDETIANLFRITAQWSAATVNETFTLNVAEVGQS